MPGLLDLLTRRDSQRLDSSATIEALRRKALFDAARPGSVGAPGGLLANPLTATGRDPVREGLLAASFAPVLGDAAGLAADVRMFQQDPETRTPQNMALSALGLLPFVPSLGIIKSVPAPSWSKVDRVDVGEDPTPQEIIDLLDDTVSPGQSKADRQLQGVLRVLEGPDGKIYLWPAADMLHAELAKALGFPHSVEKGGGFAFAEDLAPNWRPD